MADKTVIKRKAIVACGTLVGFIGFWLASFGARFLEVWLVDKVAGEDIPEITSFWLTANLYWYFPASLTLGISLHLVNRPEIDIESATLFFVAVSTLVIVWLLFGGLSTAVIFAPPIKTA